MKINNSFTSYRSLCTVEIDGVFFRESLLLRRKLYFSFHTTASFHYINKLLDVERQVHLFNFWNTPYQRHRVIMSLDQTRLRWGLAATPAQFESILTAVYQMNQRLRPVNTFDKLRPSCPRRNAQYTRQIHPVLQPGWG